MTTKFLSTSDGRRIAYHLSEGKGPTIIFCGGFKSDMTGSKAMFLETMCQNANRRFIRFDYTGHGESSGEFADGTISAWAQDTFDIVDRIGGDQNILVGSSMGGWIMLMVALERVEKIKGLVGIASAPDFTEELIWQKSSDLDRETMAHEGVIYLPSCDGEDPYPITMKLILDGRDNLLLNRLSLDLPMPIRLLHGSKDEDVPWTVSQRLMEKVTSDNMILRLVKDAGHRLSEPHELAMLQELLEEVLLTVKNH